MKFKVKKLCVILIFALTLCLFGCNSTVTPNDGQSENIQDNQDQTEFGDDSLNDEQLENEGMGADEFAPDIPDVVEIDENDKLSDLYVKDLYDEIIAKAANAEIQGGLFHSAEFKDSSMLDVNDMMRVAYCIDRDIHVHRVYNEDYGYCYDRADLRETIKRVFGIKAKIGTEEWSAGGLAFMYFGKGDFFGGEPAYGGDFPIEKIFGYFGKYELDGDYLCIYDRVLFCDHDRQDSGIIKFYSDITKTEESFVNAFHTEGYLPLDFSNEALEQYGAEYKHTFKLAEDGSYYYWVSSEPVK